MLIYKQERGHGPPCWMLSGLKDRGTAEKDLKAPVFKKINQLFTGSSQLILSLALVYGLLFNGSPFYEILFVSVRDTDRRSKAVMGVSSCYRQILDIFNTQSKLRIPTGLEKDLPIHYTSRQEECGDGD